MAHRVSRRGFLKIAAGASVVAGLSPTVRRVALEPFVRPPEEELPGRATWYASTCRQCPAGCGVIVRVINGRARKIEGNPSHPLNRGKLCARGQAGLQVLYNPDRLQSAVRQTGGRGSRRFEPVQWAEATDQLASALKGVGGRARVGFLGGSVPTHLRLLVTRFLEALGSPGPVLFDLHSVLEGGAEAHALADRWFGSADKPIYDIGHAEVIFSFGANFLETWLSPVSQSYDYGTMRQGQSGGRGFLVQFEPRLSMTAASADQWIPVPPGTEGLVALGLGRIIVEENLGRVGSHREHAQLYRDVSVGAVAEASGLSVDRLQKLARAFADADRSVALPGGYLSGFTNASQSMDAVMALNVIMRRLGREGGVFLPHTIPADAFINPDLPSPFRDFEKLIQKMRDGQVDVLMVHGANPVYELPRWAGFADALTNVPLVVSFSPFINETAAQADLILPDHTYLEGWGFEVCSPGGDRPVVSSQQPAVRPLYDTRSTADVLLKLASSLGGAVSQALPWPDEVAYLEEASAQLLGSSIGVFDARTPAGFWSRWRQLGGWWSTKPIRQEPVARGLPQGPLQVPAASFAGQPNLFPFTLLPYESIALSDGRGADQHWLQETPDPMTTACWNTWVELNPATAAQLGVTDDDIVRVVSTHNALEAPVVVFPGIRPDVVAIPTGQGHQDYGRFAAGRGSNVMDLIAPVVEREAAVLAWGGTRVRVEAVHRSTKLARLESLDGKGRETLR